MIHVRAVEAREIEAQPDPWPEDWRRNGVELRTAAAVPSVARLVVLSREPAPPIPARQEA